MKFFGEGLSEQHKELNCIIRKSDKVETAKQLFLELHAKLHLSIISNTKENEVDDLVHHLSLTEYRMMPTAKDETIAWVLWHISRIEDLTMNMLVGNCDQIFNEDWKKRLNISIIDTGNALTDDEIMEVSKQLNIEELIAYRNAVGQRTRDIIKTLSASDMKRKVSSQGIERIRQAGGVSEDEGAFWLLDFWGKKDIAGILLMPPTRHMIMHLNDCCKWRAHIQAGKKCFLIV